MHRSVIVAVRMSRVRVMGAPDQTRSSGQSRVSLGDRFWILDWGFWIGNAGGVAAVHSKIQNPQSKMPACDCPGAVIRPACRIGSRAAADVLYIVRVQAHVR